MRYSFDRNLKPSVWQGNEHFGPITLNRTSGPLGHKVDAYQRGSPLGQLAVVETMTAFMQRRLEAPTGQSTIEAGDLRVQQNRNHSPCNICLLIDASASMKGKRLQAATTLAKHLVAATRDKVAVLTFQESEVRLTVPFTRKIQELNAGLEMIKPYGLTPLAAGLAYAKDYLRQTKARNPLLVLISDGIPTVPMRSSDPIGDAIEEAKQLRDAAIHFCCIGLEPNQSVLGEVTAAARGKLHVVKELDSDALVQIVVKARESINV
jgi:magnesium chelatase subunit D